MQTNFLTMIKISLFNYCEKCVYRYKYRDDWEKCNEASFPEEEDFHSHLYMEGISGTAYAHAKRVCKDFEIKDLGEYHDFYVQVNTFLLADAFENFRNMFRKIYELDPAHFLLAPGLAQEAAIK